jgi:hypothetical protein
LKNWPEANFQESLPVGQNYAEDIMPWNLHENKDDHIIEVNLHGQVNFDELVQVRTRIAQLCRENDYRHVLVDTKEAEVAPDTSITKLFEFGTAVLKKANMPLDTKTAVIILSNTKAGKEWTFLKDVEANRGFIIKSFERREKAMEWLICK